MKKNYIAVSLLAVGVILLCISVFLTIMEAGNRNIIGGADINTFLFVFFRDKNGLYSALAFLGICSVIASVVAGAVKKK